MNPFLQVVLVATVMISAASAGDAAAAPKFKSVKPQTPEGFKLEEVTLATYDGAPVMLTIYVPPGDALYPAILDIHGGGWKDRQVENDKPMMERLAQRGFVTALVAYRLSGTAKYPAALNDCKSAVRYLRANAAKYKIDPERIGVMGGSAGGHLSGLLAMTNGKPEFEGDGPHRETSSSVKACIVMAATMDLMAANKTKTGEGSIAFFGTTFAEKPDLFKDASPIARPRRRAASDFYRRRKRFAENRPRRDAGETQSAEHRNRSAHAQGCTAPVLDEPAVARPDRRSLRGVL